MGHLAPRGTDAPWPTTNPTMLAAWLAVTITVQTRDCSEEFTFASPEQQIQASFYQVAPAAPLSRRGTPGRPWPSTLSSPGARPSAAGPPGSPPTGSSSTWRRCCGWPR